MAPIALAALLVAGAAALPPRAALAVGAALARGQEARSIPGLSAAVAIGDEVVYSAGFGLADVESAVPAAEGTVYRIASLTKPITATAVLQLAERGRLDLDAPVQRYVPAYPEKPWRVTSRLLLAHQGGLRHLLRDEWGSIRHYSTLGEALEAFKDDALSYEPGTRTLYSSYGYALLGNVVEGASGQPYLEYLAREILAPAGMTATRLDDARERIPERARGYVRRAGGETVPSIPADTSNKVAAGGLVATAPDMARFGAALQAGRLLRPETLTLMLTQQRTRDGHGTAYGLGMRVGEWRGRWEAWQHGGQPQVSTLLYLWPARRLTVAILCNLEGVAPALLDMAREVAGVLAAPPPPSLTPPRMGR